MLDVPDWGLWSWFWFEYGHWSLIHQCSTFCLSILILRCKDHPYPWSLEDAGCSWLGFDVLILIWIESLVFDIPMLQILALYLDFEWAKNTDVIQVLYGALEDNGNSWLRFGILILIWIWSLVFDIPMIQILALYLDFEGANNTHSL